MAIPSILPEWNTNETNATEPDATHKADGWLAPGGIPEKPPFQYFNFWQNSVYKWINYFTTEARRLWQNQSIVYDIASDADYTLTSDQNSYRRIEITDIGGILTGPKNIIINTSERSIFFKNSTAQTLTVKTPLGTGVAVLSGNEIALFCNGTNIIMDNFIITKKYVDDKPTGLKNHIINGEFAIQQRGDIDTAPVAMVNNTYQIDRFVSSISVVTGTIQRLLAQTVNGRKVSTVKCVATSTTTGSIGLLQKVEIFYNGETKTFGAWVKSNNPTARAQITDGVINTVSTPHSGNGLWEFLSFDKTIDVSATQLFCYVLIPTGSITTGDYIESTMWQLEDGTVATPFEQRPIGLEEMLCNRYFQVLKQPRVIGQCVTTTRVSQLSLNFNKMRVIPSVDIGAVGNWNVTGAGGTAYPVTAINTIVTRNGSYHFTADIGTSSLVTGNASSAYTNLEEVFLDAEL